LSSDRKQEPINRTSTGDASLDRLIAALCQPARYAHPVGAVELLQTHISCVLLAGDYAYKIKKPVNLGFLDFTTLAARRHYCEEELRINRRTAPGLYLEVVAIGGSVAEPAIGGAGAAIEYALRMRRFAQDDLLDRMARQGRLLPQHIDALARDVAAFHARIGRAGADQAFGNPQHILAPALQNFEQLLALACDKVDIALLARLRDWTIHAHAALAPVFATRKRDGWVRECHGDLHLGNIALLEGAPTPFDGIEFNPAFRWIDVMGEVAFLAMDLFDHRLPRLAYRFLNTYLEITGDYAGLRVLRFYLVYRALVRAKVSALKAHQPGMAAKDRSETEHAYRRHLYLSERLARPAHPAMLIMHGLSGSGKTTVSQFFLESPGAVRLRSDVERKRLYGIAAAEHSNSALDAGLYTPAASRRTYGRLADLARAVLDARYPVIVDAAFLRRAERDRFAQLARDANASFLIAACAASPATLRERVAARERDAEDASDAGVTVLQRQIATAEPLTADEIAHTMTLDAERGAAAPEAEELARRLGLETARTRAPRATMR